ncbi:unnamed protein product [Medioppia subpectinata]|uniref:guanylate cyclase n=1 Tax=Medioppia subpectinata TaxID=1979941 RepID=A0A7R9L6N3_9ACAR|nr:unnamed protein product [Medioppia subpectinata]CAG2115279.1 unnamed protein product [Medioppia subpectinata]
MTVFAAFNIAKLFDCQQNSMQECKSRMEFILIGSPKPLLISGSVGYKCPTRGIGSILMYCVFQGIDMRRLSLFGGSSSGRSDAFCLNGNEVCTQSAFGIGVYKGNVVAIKRIFKKSIDLTRNVRKELIQVREMRHENINSFIGASIESTNISLIFLYCARGSLEDVLRNEDLDLDNIRWVLQITDYGLHEFRANQDFTHFDEHKRQRDLLWKAPELLRTINPPMRGTQKGDVYSFLTSK